MRTIELKPERTPRYMPRLTITGINRNGRVTATVRAMYQDRPLYDDVAILDDANDRRHVAQQITQELYGDSGSDELKQETAAGIEAALLRYALPAEPSPKVFTPPAVPIRETTAEENPIAPIITTMADVDPVPVAWLWPAKIPLGKITLFTGDPGLGKSFVTTDLAARVSNGSPWPDGSGESPLGDVLLVTFEDDPADTIRPRLDAAGADVSRVHLLEGVRFLSEGGEKRERSLTLADIPIIRAAIDQKRDTKLLVIDPVSAALAAKDSHKDSEIRGLLAPLAKLASEYGVAVLLITHLNKSGSNRAMYRSMGSLAFIAACRAAWLFIKDPDDALHRGILPIKNNLANDQQGIGYRILEGRVAWDKDAFELSADEALAGDDGSTGPKPYARDAAQEFLKELLKDGTVASKQVESEAKEAGIAIRTVRRAADALGILRQKNTFSGAWEWRFPKP